MEPQRPFAGYQTKIATTTVEAQTGRKELESSRRNVEVKEKNDKTKEWLLLAIR